ncbi:MAG: hypothetical protein WCC42_09735 [Pseudolabrys sp.]
MTKDETEGRIRAIEAVLLHLPEISPGVMQAAKAWIRNPKRQPDSKVAEVKLQISGHLDEHAEKALDELTYQFQKLQGVDHQSQAAKRKRSSPPGAASSRRQLTSS